MVRSFPSAHDDARAHHAPDRHHLRRRRPGGRGGLRGTEASPGSRREDGAGPGRLRVLDQGDRPDLLYGRERPRQLQRGHARARLCRSRRGGGQLRRRRARRLGLGHDGTGPRHPDGARAARLGHLRAARRDVGHTGRGPHPDQGWTAHGHGRRRAGVADRWQAAMSGRRPRQGARRGGGEPRLRAQPGPHGPAGATR